jgi:hypothetical protein
VSTRIMLLYAVAAIAGLLAVRLIVSVTWWIIGRYRLQRAGPPPVRASVHRIWSDPGLIQPLDFAMGPGGAAGVPRPPFVFRKEHLNGSQPCVAVEDGLGRMWRVKWGPEVHSETFAVRFAWACGYFTEVTHFLPRGTIEAAKDLQRAAKCVAENGAFSDARFELEDQAAAKMFEEHSWSWAENPFVGTPELNGLKVVVMLLSNWDTKDRRDVARGSNTAIFEYQTEQGREARYLVTDWGGSMGRWGSNLVRGRWDPDGFSEQTPHFVYGLSDGSVTFGYSGQRTADIAQPIPVGHVRWLLPYLERLNETVLMRGLLESGASHEEAQRFAAALLDRIGRLRAVTEGCDSPLLRGAETTGVGTL